MAANEARQEFDERIAESLDDGDAFLHKYVKAEPVAPPVSQQDGRWVTDLNDLLQLHSRRWSEQWLVHDEGKVNESAQALRDALSFVQSAPGKRTRKKYTPVQIRMAARRFKRRTAIGTDNWQLADFARMPDSALEILAELLADIQQDAVPPLQMLTNVMATLPKKDGGTRTVAIASSLYRLLMELDSMEVKEFEAANAFANDSGKKGGIGVTCG